MVERPSCRLARVVCGWTTSALGSARRLEDEEKERDAQRWMSSCSAPNAAGLGGVLGGMSSEARAGSEKQEASRRGGLRRSSDGREEAAAAFVRRRLNDGRARIDGQEVQEVGVGRAAPLEQAVSRATGSSGGAAEGEEEDERGEATARSQTQAGPGREQLELSLHTQASRLSRESAARTRTRSEAARTRRSPRSHRVALALCTAAPAHEIETELSSPRPWSRKSRSPTPASSRPAVISLAESLNADSNTTRTARTDTAHLSYFTQVR